MICLIAIAGCVGAAVVVADVCAIADIAVQWQEQRQLVEQRFLHAGQPSGQFGAAAVVAVIGRGLCLAGTDCAVQCAQRLCQQRGDSALAQIGAGLLLDALDGAQSAQYPGNFAAQGLLGLGQCGALLGRQAAGLIWGLRLALGVQQGEHHVAVVAVEGKLALTGKGFQCSKGLGLRSFVVGDERGVVGAVVGFLQALGNVAGQGLQQFVHALAQQSALACGQAQRVWALGFVKVVQIAQVRRHRAQRSGLVHGLGQQ